MAFSGNAFSMNNIASAIPGIAQGLFGNSGAPYAEAGRAYQPFYQEAQKFQNPFYNAGVNNINRFQNWLEGMGNPSDFINRLMGNYQQSPYAKNLQQEAMRAGTNAASASGLIGSTPFAQQLQQNAANISSQDMNQWLQNVLGINTQYGAGLAGLLSGGQHAGDILSQLAEGGGRVAGGSAYGQEFGRQQDRRGLWDSIAGLFGG